MLKIACVACLEPGISVHTDTFVRAVELFCELRQNDEFRVHFFDDKADADVASRVCQEIVAEQVDCVVGHFLSDAADVAAPVYAKADIPLLLPAATRASLTTHDTTFRVCDSETAYVAWLKRVLSDMGRSIRSIERDDSLHAAGLAEALTGENINDSDNEAGLKLFVGKFQNTLAYLQQCLDEHGSLPATLLTDDAYSPKLLQELTEKGVDWSATELWIAALQPQAQGEFAARLSAIYQQRYRQVPGTYFWETIAALEIATNPAFHEAFQSRADCRLPTVLGSLSFGDDREAKPTAFQLLRCDQDGFTELCVSPEAETIPLAKDFRRVLSARKLVMKQPARQSDDYGRNAVEAWASNYAGAPIDGVQEEILGEYTRRYRCLDQNSNPERTLIYLHGGGLVYYRCETFAPFMSYLAKQLGVSVIALDYEKLPENSAESVIERLILRIAGHTRGRQNNLIMGDSIGGLLALYIATQRLPERFTLAGLIYPVLALFREYPSYRHHGKGRLLDASAMRWFRSMVRPYFKQQGFDPFDLDTTKLNDALRISVFSAGHDVLIDENNAFVRMLGERVSYQCFADLPHDFCLYQGTLDSAQQAVASLVQHINTQIKE